MLATERTTSFYQLALAAIGLAAIAALAVTRAAGFPGIYHSILGLWGVEVYFHPYVPFVDLEEFLAALQCKRAGLDVFLRDPCDILGRPHVYPIWLTPRMLSVGVTDTTWLGLCLGSSFMCVVAWIAKPRSLGEATIYLFGMLSPASAYAVERGNMDLLVFNLTVFAIFLFRRSGYGRLMTYAVIFFLGTLKFYPIVAMGLALKEKAVRLLILVGTTTLAWFLFLYVMRQQLAEMVTNYPYITPVGGYVFGGPSLSMMLQDFLSSRFQHHESVISAAAHGFYVIAVLAAFIISIFLVRKKCVPQLSIALPASADLQFIAGSLMLVGVFFVSVNNSYREIYLLLFLPLFVFARNRSLASEGAGRRFWSIAIALVLVMLWYPSIAVIILHLGGGNRTQMALTVLVRDPIWWTFVTGTMALLWTRILPATVLKTPLFHP